MEKTIEVNGHEVYLKKKEATEGGGLFFLKLTKAMGPALVKAISEASSDKEVSGLVMINVLCLSNPEELWPTMMECVKNCKIDGQVATDEKIKESFPDTGHIFTIFSAVVSLNFQGFFGSLPTK